MHKSAASTAIVLLLSAISVRADDVGRLDVEFDTPVASIPLRTAQRLVNLPNLTFLVRASASCPAGQTAESVSVSIADTRISISPTEDETVEQTIKVAAKQLGPVAIDSFCLAEDKESSIADDALLIDGALTAQLSLRCVGENSESIHYETAALSVALQCAVPDAAPTVTGDPINADQ